MSVLVRVALKDSKEKAAMYLGWVGFALVIIGLFSPWGTYRSGFTNYSVSGFTTTYGFFLIIGALAITAGLLSSTVKLSSASIAFLGTGAMGTILFTGMFLTTYYGQGPPYYSQIQYISVGSFITLIGGFATVASAILYSLHVRTPTTEEKPQTSTPAP
jgi:hypothetical protein